ncbi:PEP/pyruvate-binding domain-containing protein [Streptomyces sp. NPDC005125]
MSSVLLVHAVGGPPLDYALPRVAAHAEVHVLALSPLPEATQDVWLPHCASVTETVEPETGAELVATIVRLARKLGTEAVLTLSEFAVVAVARACQELGLAGAGPKVEAARDKREMRAVWRDAGVPIPAFAEVGDETELHEAFLSLRPPLLLKSAWSAGSTAHVTVHTVEEARQAFRRGRAVLRATAREGYAELSAEGTGSQFLLEEIVTGTTKGWFEDTGWGDYVSVEGIVADGIYHPLCISGRMPTVPPFIERASVTPVALPEELQRKIENVARDAVDALGLGTCGTHTEIKLGPDGRMWVIETAARFGGVLTLGQAEDVFGLDMIGMLVQQLLGLAVSYPLQMQTHGKGAAASLVVLPVDADGREWQGNWVWEFDAVDWTALVSADTRVAPVAELSLPDGALIAPHDSVEGGRSRVAVCYVTGADEDSVLADCHSIVRALPGSLRPALDESAEAGDILDLERFDRLRGILAGHPYVKVVVDREAGDWHVLDTAEHSFHAHYIADRILGKERDELHADIDAFNRSVYQDADRRFLLGVLSLHQHTTGDVLMREPFMVLETVEADTMGPELLTEFYGFVRARLVDALRLFVKPANHGQEAALSGVPQDVVPRIAGHQLYTAADFAALNVGEARGRLRYFPSVDTYRAAMSEGSIAWYDILAMPTVPDDIPRVAGLISALPTTPLSHTNVLAAGWGIPNAVVRDIAQRVTEGDLADTWVRFAVNAEGAELVEAEEPADLDEPVRQFETVRIGAPRVERLAIVPLSELRAEDRHGYGTKAAHLGELHHVLRSGSVRLTGYYTVPRPPRAHLLGHLAQQLGAAEDAGPEELCERAGEFLAEHISAPEGIAVPFEFQQRFLAGTPAIQQRIGMLKMALSVGAFESVDRMCAELQNLVRKAALPDEMVRHVHDQVFRNLVGTRALVVRSSSNAEDLPGFSAAGLYESVSRVGDVTGLADAIRQVWASLFSARSVLLRHQAGIPLDDTYMGVIVQRRHDAALGGVMVTCNPTRRDDFRNVCVNCTTGSPEEVVEGSAPPMQYLYNTVEGGGRTISLGAADRDVSEPAKQRLSQLALAGRLLQGHFSHDLTFAGPLDIEWLLDPEDRLHLLQVRPYAV